MANTLHVAIVQQGAKAVQEYREVHPDLVLDLRNADLEGINLTGDDPLALEDGLWLDPPQGADLSHANLQGANLRNAYLYWIKLVNADLTRANLCRAYLPWAVLLRANLTDADLTGADFREANLEHAVLSGAQLYRTDFYDAKLADADLRGADLRGSLNLRSEQVRQAYTAGGTKLPIWPSQEHRVK